MPGYRVLLLDMDGVLWRGGQPIDVNLEAIRTLASRGVRIAYVTNNSTKSRRSYVERLRALGLPASVDTVVTSGYAASTYMARRGVRTVYVVGEDGLVEEARLAGLEPLEECPDRVDAVVVGLDRGFNYGKLDCAARHVRRGALYVATNADPTLPHPGEPKPGAGAMVAAISVASGREPDFTAGKPNPWLVELALEALGAEPGEALLVGDRLDTDIEAGRRAGVDTLLVYTGVTGPEDPLDPEPTYTAGSLLEALRLFG